MTTESPMRGLLGRRRRENIEGGRQHRHVVKVSPAEEARLLARAEALHITVPRLLVEAALAPEGGLSASERREMLVELFAVHRLLGTIANNVNQMAKATNATGAVHEDMRATLAAVRRTALRIDAAIEALPS